MTIAFHETAGDRVQDRTCSILFKKPALERVDIVAGAGKGSGRFGSAATKSRVTNSRRFHLRANACMGPRTFAGFPLARRQTAGSTLI
jgi:hypothetical protein